MADRGYPVAEFEQRAEDVSVDHAGAVENYRSARAIAVESGQGTADTEAHRTAMTRYRALFDDLLGVGAQPMNSGATPVAPPPTAPPAAPLTPTGSSPR